MIDHQVNRGDERYSDHLHKVNLITFINDIDKDNLVLIDSYVPRNEYGNVRKFNLATSYFVQLPFIKVRKLFKIRNLNLHLISWTYP
jgi:hypothetical protein